MEKIKKLVKITLIGIGVVFLLFVTLMSTLALKSPSPEELISQKEKQTKEQIQKCKEEDWAHTLSTLKLKTVSRKSVTEIKQLIDICRDHKLLPKNIANIEKEINRKQKEFETLDKEFDNFVSKHGERSRIGKWTIKNYLKEIARDPDSVDVSKCAEPKWGDKKGWELVCYYRARNGFGGINLEVGAFYISKDLVVHHERINP